MKSLILLSFSLLIGLNSIGKTEGYEIKGTLKGSYTGNVYLKIGAVKDTAVITNGSFVFKGVVKDTMRVYINLDYPSNIEDFYLENSKITLNVSDTLTKDADGINWHNLNIDTIIGSKSFEIQTKFDKAMNKISDADAPDSVKAKEIYNELVKLITKHPAHPFSASSYAWNARKLSLGKALALYDLLDKKALAGTEEEMLATQALKKMQEAEKGGNQFTDFEQTNPDGVNINTNKFRGKLLIVDFWASWCGPCRAQLPEVKRIYNAYHAKGVEMISVSLDSDRDKWLAAIKKEEMDWTNVSDLKGWQNAAAQIYSIQSIPRIMLVDEKGFVINPGLSPATLEAELQKRLH